MCFIGHRVVDSFGNTIGFVLIETRDTAAAKAFFRKAFKYNSHPKGDCR